MIKSTFKKIITSILGFFGIMTFTSCYGMPANENWISLSGTVTGDDDGSASTPAVPVEGIRVSVQDSAGKELAYSQTDEDGMYYMEMETEADVIPAYLTYIFEDIDGEKNGSYKKKTETKEFTESGSGSFKVDAELERADSEG